MLRGFPWKIKWKSCMNAEIIYGFYSKSIWVSKTNKVPQISIDDTCSGKGFFPAAQTWNDTGGCVKDFLTLKRIYLLWHWQPVHVWKERRYSYRLCVLTTNMTDTPGLPKIPVVFISLLLAVCHFLLHTWTMTAAHTLSEWVPPNRSGPQAPSS